MISWTRTLAYILYHSRYNKPWSYLLMEYLLFLELLIHRLGDPKCVVSGISGCSHMFVIIRHFIVSVRRTGTFLVYIYIYIIREEAQSFATHDLRCRACLPNSELAVWWTSVSRWFLTYTNLKKLNKKVLLMLISYPQARPGVVWPPGDI